MQDIPTARLPLHFDVPSEYLNADNYLVAVNSFKTCLSDFNKRLFQENINYEFVVLPSEIGSFKGVIGIVLKKPLTSIMVVGSVASLIESDLVKGLVEGLTGQKIDYYEATHKAGEFLVDLTTGFFSTETEELERMVPDSLNLDKSFHAKSEFYKECIHNCSVSGVGFTDEHKFPVRRDSFPKHVSKEKVRSVKSDFVLHRVIVVSPVDIDVDQIWRFKDPISGKSLKAYMRDKNFKQGFLGGRYPLKQSRKDDHIIMLVEYKKQERNGEVESKEVCVHTVYTFNEIEIVPLPEDKKVAGIRLTDTHTLPMEDFWTT